MQYQKFKEVLNHTQTKDKIIYLMLFLFPVAGPVVRHWNSLFFMLIFLLAIYFLATSKTRHVLLREEKILIIAFSLFFVSFLISANLQGWSKHQTLELGNEIRFLLFVPIYLLIREYTYSLKALLAGLLLYVPVVFFFALYEYWYVRVPVEGAYSVLFIGPITALSLLFYPAAYRSWFNGDKYNWIVYIAFLMGIFVIAFSFARTAYLTFCIGSILLALLYVKNHKRAIYYLIAVLIMISGLLTQPQINGRVMIAIDNVEQYFTQYNDIKSDARKTSLGLRLEMWRASQYAIKEHPVFGIAPSNFPAFIEPYIQKGVVNEGVRIAGTLHNTFVEVIVSKGIFGLTLLLIILYYPLYMGWKHRQKCTECFHYIAIFAVSVTSISMGLSNFVNKNNAVSYLIIFTAILFSHLMRKIYPQNFTKDLNLK